MDRTWSAYLVVSALKRLKRCYYSWTGYFFIIYMNTLLFKWYCGILLYVNCHTKTAVNNALLFVHNLFHINFAVIIITKPFLRTESYRGQCYTHASTFVVSFNNNSVEISGTEYRRSIYVPSYQISNRCQATWFIPESSNFHHGNRFDGSTFCSTHSSFTRRKSYSMGIFQCPKILHKSLNVIQNTPFRYDRSRIVIYDGPRFQMP